MTREDFQIIRASVSMEQVITNYGLTINSKHMIRCPFHSEGSERTASMSIRRYGFRCFGCGESGDMIRFVELYENLTAHEAAKVIADRFNIPVSECGKIDPTTLKKARKAISEHQRLNNQLEALTRSMSDIGACIRAYEAVQRQAEPFGDVWCWVVDELPGLIGKWEGFGKEIDAILWTQNHPEETRHRKL